MTDTEIIEFLQKHKAGVFPSEDSFVCCADGVGCFKEATLREAVQTTVRALEEYMEPYEGEDKMTETALREYHHSLTLGYPVQPVSETDDGF